MFLSQLPLSLGRHPPSANVCTEIHMKNVKTLIENYSAPGPSILNSLMGLLALFRGVLISHEFGHWMARGDSSYSDHLLFERMIGDYYGRLDELAEKIIGYGQGSQSFRINIVEHLNQVVSKVEDMSDVSSDFLFLALNSEKELLSRIHIIMDELSDSESSNAGLEDYLSSLASVSERHVYLLTQRLY